MTRFEMKVSAVMKPLLALVGARAGKRYVAVDGDRVEIRMGWTKLEVAVGDIASVQETRWPLIYGLGPGRLAPKKTLGVVSSSRGTVRIALRQAIPFKVPFSLERENLVVALDDPKAFIAAVEEARGEQRQTV